MSAEEVFRALEADSISEVSGYLYRRVLPGSPFDVWLEVVRLSAARRLCVKVPSSAITGAPKRTRGFSVAYSSEDELLRVELQDSRLSPLFSAVVDNFLAALAEAPAGTDPTEIVLDRLALWKRLFEEASFEGLSDEVQRGLFAELTFLCEVVVPMLGPLKALLAWQAPDRTAKDFIYEKVAVEVKSRLKKGPTKVRISSENQLDLLGFDLLLAVETLDPETSQGQSLPEIIRRLRSTFATSGATLIMFDDQLLRVGYLDAHEHHYADVKYTSVASYYHVREGFPRLTPADIPSGLSHVSYDVDLASVAPFAVGVHKVRDWLRGERA